MTDLQPNYIERFVKKNGLTIEQEAALCAIQKAAGDNDRVILEQLPPYVVLCAFMAQQEFSNNGISELAEMLDKCLIDAVKECWAAIEPLHLAYVEEEN